MARYRVKPGCCLHLPYQAFALSGEEVDLAGGLEQEVLAGQGWKIEPFSAEPDNEKPKDTGPEEKKVDEPPKDRAVKEAKAK